jgi:hypothetical protein
MLKISTVATTYRVGGAVNGITWDCSIGKLITVIKGI